MQDSVVTTKTSPALYHRVVNAIELRNGGDIRGAIAALWPYATLTPDGALVALTLGKLYAEAGDAYRAHGWLTRAAELDPKSFDVRLALATLHAESGAHRKAVEAFLAISRDGLALMLELDAQGRFDALEELASLLDAARHNRLQALVELGEHDSVLFEIGFDLNSAESWREAHYFWAQVIERQGRDPTEAAKDGFELGCISPLMTGILLRSMLEQEPVDLGAIDEVVRNVDELFAEDFEWWRVDASLVQTMENLRRRALRAMMRGEVPAENVLRLLRLPGTPMTEEEDAEP